VKLPNALTREEVSQYQQDRAASVLSEEKAAAFRDGWEGRLRELGYGLDALPLHVPGDVSFAPEDPEEAALDRLLAELDGDSPDQPHEADGAAGRRRAGKASDVLVRIAKAEGELFHAPDGTDYARVVVGDHHEVWPLRSSGFRKWLTRRFYEEQRTNPNGNALSEALLTLAGIASYDGPEHAVHLRVARHGEALYVDLANDRWEVVEVTPAGWRVMNEPPVRFRRTRSMAPLPSPETGGTLEALRDFINVADDDAWRLLAAWFLFAFSPTGPYPVLILHGEQGSAKSTAARLLRQLIDPTIGSGLRAAPKDVEDLAVATHNSHVVALDNLSGIQPWLSDALCRVATGAGLSKRELYTDAEETVLEACRPLVLNGITELATRGDLFDRAILVDLDPIPDENRRTEAEVRAGFEAVRPGVFGALLDALSTALRRLPETRLPKKPRMADFALFVTAAEEALGWPAGSFIASYEANRAQGNDLALDANPVGVAVRELVDNHGGDWAGTAQNLLDEVGQFVREEMRRSRYWPGTAWAMSNQLTRLTPNLRAAGIEVSRERANDAARTRVITLRAGRRTQPDEPAGAASLEEGGH
jgi:hypothetical protein